MKIKILKVPNDGTYYCDNDKCECNPIYLRERSGYESGRPALKEGVTIAYITFFYAHKSICFCLDCIDVFYKEVKMKMDKSLWPFH